METRFSSEIQFDCNIIKKSIISKTNKKSFQSSVQLYQIIRIVNFLKLNLYPFLDFNYIRKETTI